MADTNLNSVASTGSAISRLADSANEKQQMNLDFINYVVDLSNQESQSTTYTADATGGTSSSTSLYSDNYMSACYGALYSSFGQDLFDSFGASSIVSSDGQFTAGGSSLVSYYTQLISDSITVLGALGKSASNIEKNTMQSMSRDLQQAG